MLHAEGGIIASNFTDSSVILLNLEHDYWYNLENTDLGSLVHDTLYMELLLIITEI